MILNDVSNKSFFDSNFYYELLNIIILNTTTVINSP